MMIDPLHSGPTCNGYSNGDHAGTPSPPLSTRLGWKVGFPYIGLTRPQEDFETPAPRESCQSVFGFRSGENASVRN